MVTYNNKEYANFSEFAKAYQNRYAKVDFTKVDFTLSKDVDSLTKEDVNAKGVYQISDGKFFMTSIFENTYTEISKEGNVKNCNAFQIMLLEKPNKKGERVIKINDSSQLKRTIGAMLGKNPSGIKCKAQKSKIDADVIRAKFADFEEFLKNIGYTINLDEHEAQCLQTWQAKIEADEKAQKVADIMKAMKVSEEVAEKMYYALKA